MNVGDKFTGGDDSIIATILDIDDDDVCVQLTDNDNTIIDTCTWKSNDIESGLACGEYTIIPDFE